jgi:hypothetical protein
MFIADINPRGPCIPSALERASIMGLAEGQRVAVDVAQGQKGPKPSVCGLSETPETLRRCAAGLRRPFAIPTLRGCSDLCGCGASWQPVRLLTRPRVSGKLRPETSAFFSAFLR